MNLCDIKNKKVLVRVNYDLPNLADGSRILDSKKTIDLLIQNNNKVVLMSHWGRPRGGDQELSLERLKPFIEKILGVDILFLNQYEYLDKDEDDLSNEIENSNHQLILLENTRFSEFEKAANNKAKNLAKKYASLADFFVDEAFAVSHRNEVTNSLIKEYIDFDFGLSYKNEIKNLDEFKNGPRLPKYVIMGGAKLETKLPVIENLIEVVDKIFVCGKLCFTFLEARNQLGGQFVDIRDSGVEDSFLGDAKHLLLKHSQKIILPNGMKFGEVRGKFLGLDIDEGGLAYFIEELGKVQGGQIFWNGPLGQYEISPFEQGTVKLAEAMVKIPDTKIYIGGGDTVSSLSEEIKEQFDFISMGGGATLYYLSA